MSPYEVAMLQNHSGKGCRTALGWGIAGLSVAVVGVVGAAAYANAKGNGNKHLIESNQAHAMQIQSMLAGQIAQNRATTEAALTRNTPSLIDYVNVTTSQSQGQGQTATSALEAQLLATAYASAVNNGGGIGQFSSGSVTPLAVSLYQPAQPCCCPNPCSCNG